MEARRRDKKGKITYKKKISQPHAEGWMLNGSRMADRHCYMLTDIPLK